MTRPANPDLPVKVIDEAERIVVRNGHQKLSMRELSEELGVSATAIYHYFKDRAAILLQVRIRAVEHLNRRIKSIDTSLSLQAYLRGFADAYLTFAEEEPHLYRLLFATSIPVDALAEQEQAKFAFTYNRLYEAFSRCETDNGQPFTPNAMATIAWTVLHGYVRLLQTQHLPTSGYDDIDTARADILRWFEFAGKR